MGKKCIVCNNLLDVLMNDKILNHYFINYYLCNNCKSIQTENPFWLNEAYSESIAVSDTGIMSRNIDACAKLMFILKRYFKPSSKVVDYGGGYGILTRMLRDKGVDAYWSDKYSENLLARGFEYDGSSPVDVIVAFEVMEHLVNPLEEIKEILSKTDCLIFSVSTLKRTDFKSNTEWWYFVPESGQHIFFPSEVTFRYIANELNIKYFNLWGLHILSRKIKFLKIRNLDLFLYYIRQGISYRFLKRKKKGFISKTLEDSLLYRKTSK
jgi:hypothetical protein